MKTCFSALLIVLCINFSFSQVGINTATPSAASVLDIESSIDGINYGGFLPPRVSLSERNSIGAGTTDDGMLIFLQDGTTRCVQIWDGVNSSWENVYCMPIVAVDPWINEIHYDNSGADVNEGAEIAGAAGTDLTGWTVELYNGSTGVVYSTITLSGSIDDEGTGYGAVNFLQASIQNGAPDGLALVNASGAVIQFLSYEGTFTATAGAANGMTSTDIGQAEGSGTAVGESLQLTGTGNQYSDFNWAPAQAHTRDSVNTGQTIN